MISDIENSLLVKYLKNELSEEESQKVIGWLEQNKENQEFLFGLKDLYICLDDGKNYPEERIQLMVGRSYLELSGSSIKVRMYLAPI